MDLWEISLLDFVFSCTNRCAHSLPFATVEPEEISASQPAEVYNLGR